VRVEPAKNPIQERTLVLSEELFEDDAIIVDQLASVALRYGADRGPAINLSWEGFRELGLWSKPGGAPFICIEPWYGFASPEDFDGDFATEPGVMHLAVGEKRRFVQRIAID
jgi:galactose mutarotase-like enzyme